MQSEEEARNTLFEKITKELTSIIEEGSENSESNLYGEKEASRDCDELNEMFSSSKCGRKENIESKDEFSSGSIVLDTCTITNINDDVQKLQNKLDDSSNLFQTIGELFENINFGCLKNRIRDINLDEGSGQPLKVIVNDLEHSFEEKYMQNRLDDLTKEVRSKFRNHPGEFCDIPEISEFFRTCSKLNQGLVMLRKQREDCMYLQKRMIRVAEASYDRVNIIQQKIIGEENVKPQDLENCKNIEY